MSLENLSTLFAPPPAPAPEADHFLAQFNAEEWEWLQGHPDALAAYRLAFETRQQREAGMVPPTYTNATTCQGCGPVPIWRGAPDHVMGCPWCSNRANGRPIPRPTPSPANAGGPTLSRTVAHESN